METLYKYVSAKQALISLPKVGDGTLRATQPAALNDPMECAMLIGSQEGDEAAENRQIAETLSLINSATPVCEADVANARSRYGSLFLRELLAKKLSTRFGIVAFSENPRHPLMWAHYTIDGSGFVIGYDANYLRRLSSWNDGLRRILYQIEPPSLPVQVQQYMSEWDVTYLLALKSYHWKYEAEWRLIIELNKTIDKSCQDRHGYPIRLLSVPNESVVSLYYTERTPIKTVDEISDRLANRNNKYGEIRQIRLVLSRNGYGYEDEDAD